MSEINKDPNPILFEGMATMALEISGQPRTPALDVYVTIRVEMMDDVLCRWYGTITHLLATQADTTQAIPSHGPWSLCLSDGRMGVVDIPNPPVGEKVDFLGTGLPPGFKPLYTRAVLPPEYFEAMKYQTLPLPVPVSASQWRAYVGRVLFVLGFAGLLTSVWQEGPDQSRWVWSSTFLWFASMIMFATQTTWDRKAREEADRQAGIKVAELKERQDRNLSQAGEGD